MMDKLKWSNEEDVDTQVAFMWGKINEIIDWINSQGPIRGDNAIEQFVTGEKNGKND